MRIVSSLGFLAALAWAAPTPVPAQTVPNLSGTWVLQVDKSDFGMMQPVQSRTDVIDHQEPKLLIKRTTANTAGETVTTDFVFAIDGQPHQNSSGPTEIVSRLSWDGPVLVSVSTATVPQGEVTITDRYTVSEDGKTLTQQRTLSLEGQEGTQTFVLVKQP